jgi:hypothetical protein
MPSIPTDNRTGTAMDREGLLALLRSWKEDKTGYDKRAWPILKKAIEENRLSSRRRFDKQAARDEQTASS